MNNSIYLVGNTGFVGSNLMQCEDFTMSAHSLDVTKMYGHRPDVLVYAGKLQAQSGLLIKILLRI